MSPKRGRGQPPKLPENRKSSQIGLRVTAAERAILEEAHRLSGSTESFSRWMVGMSVEEAKKIIAIHLPESAELTATRERVDKFREGIEKMFEEAQKDVKEMLRKLENNLKSRDQ